MIKYEVAGNDRLITALDSVNLTLADFRPIWREATKLFYEFEKEAFATEGRSSAVGQWKLLTRAYARWKEVKAPGKPILELTGALKASLTRPNAKGSIRRVTEEEMIVGTSIFYAEFHQAGTRKMVERPPIALQPEQTRQIEKLMRDTLKQFVRRAGFIVTEG